MAKKKKKETPHIPNEAFEQRSVTELLPYAMGRYAEAVILDRAIPDIRDGLKPVHRRLLYTMHKYRFGSTNKHTKLAKISGLVLGFHPHNSLAISDAAVLLSQNWVQNATLVEIEGNNGSIDGDAHAADRYIEARLTPEAEFLLQGLDENSVDFVPTYDNEDEEPVVLPAEWPVLFTNGAMGIAVGFATNIPPHNPVELLHGAELVNRKPETTLPELLTIVQGPDFPTGGTIMGRDGLVDAYTNGKGTFVVRGRAEVENGDIVITEIPYDVRKKELVEDIVKVIDQEDLLIFVDDIIDESEGTGVRVVIKLEPEANAEMILNVLYKKSKLQQNFSANFVAIHDGSPVTVGLVDYLNTFVEFKKEVVRRRYAHEWVRRVSRLELVNGFLRLHDIAEEVVRTIKTSDGKQHAIELLISVFEFTEAQAKAIAEMALYRISNQDAEKLSAEKKQLTARLKRLKTLATDEEVFQEDISRQLLEMAEMFDSHERRTRLQDDVEEIVIEKTELIQERDVVVVVKPFGAQTMTETVYENNKEKYKEAVVSVVRAQTTDKIVFLTRKGELIQRFVDELPNLTITQEPDDWHKTIKTFKSDDDIISATAYTDQQLYDLMVLSFTKYGQVKKHPLSTSLLSFNNKGYLTRSKTYNGLKLENDEVSYVDIDLRPYINAQAFKLQRESGGHVFDFSPAELNEQGTSGSGTNWVKVKDADDFVKIIEKI